MSALTIHHSPAEGTLVLGTAKGDGSADTLRAHRFRWGRSIGAGGAWYKRGTRDAAPDRPGLAALADALIAAGFAVELELDDTSRSIDEREAARAERSEARAGGLAAKAVRTGEASTAAWDRAHEMGSIIPFGQPVLVGHHSEGRDRRYRARIGAKMDKAVELDQESRDAERRAAAAEGNQAHHLSMGATLRRIAKLEAEARDIDRKMTPCPKSGRRMKADAEGRSFTCPSCYAELVVIQGLVPHHGGATGEWADQLRARRLTVLEDLDYWRAHVATLEAAGVKVWGPADFRVGDRVNGNSTVARVNAKSISVRHDVWGAGAPPRPLPYDKVHSMQRPESDTP